MLQTGSQARINLLSAATFAATGEFKAEELIMSIPRSEFANGEWFDRVTIEFPEGLALRKREAGCMTR